MSHPAPFRHLRATAHCVSMVSCVIMVRCAGTALLTALAAPPALGDVDADIERRIADVKAAQELVTDAEQEIRQAIQQVEADEQALLNKLGQTHDALQRERARNAALEAELDRLRPVAPVDGAASIAPADPPLGAEPPGPAAAWLPWPPRELNPLGLVRSQETDLGPAPPGTDGLAIHLPKPAATPDTVTPLRARVEPSRLVFERPGPSGDSVAVAELRLADGHLIWAWRGFSPLRLGDAMNDLDRRLRRAVIEVRGGHAVLMTAQFEPPRHRFSSVPEGPDPARFDCLLGETSGRFVPGPAAAGWVLRRAPDHALEWISRGQTIAVALQAVSAEQCRLPVTGTPQPSLAVTARRGPGLDLRLAELDRQIAQWQRDLQPSAPPGVDTARAQELVAALTAERAELLVLQPRLGPTETAGGSTAAAPALTSDLTFTLVGGQPQTALFQFGFE